MVRLSKLTDYASVILAQMARKPDVLWSAGQLSEDSLVPKPTCIKLLKLLVKGGVLNSTQGARGGYSLARPPSQIPVKTIIEAIEGPTAITECGTDETLCRLTDHCSVMSRW
ncbi:MAG: SUF system Fe-S cluster assembly regulator, partial [Litorivicinaceae bacterium]|nr:SUF system Fe-S cluster assembly regulator [Litorivicinaceae bacterium]